MKKSIKTSVTAFIFGALLVGTASAAEFQDVCTRTPAYTNFLVRTLGKTCDQITADDLAGVLRVSVFRRGVTVFDPRDVANLENLEILNLNANPFTELPAEAFVSLPNLKTLVLIETGLLGLPEDFLEGNSKIENLIMYQHPFTSIPPVVLARIQELPALKILEVSSALVQEQKDELRARFPEGGAVELIFRD